VCGAARRDRAIDIFTHGFAGYLIGRAGPEQRAGKRAVAAAALGSILPDADHFVELAGSATYLELHRGWTHSVGAVLAWGALSAWLLGRGRSGRERAWLALAGMLGVASHILLDCATAFGTRWLMPFTAHRFALDWVFLIDPAFAAILLAAMAATWRWPRRAERIAGAGLVLIGLYLGLCAGCHATALARVEGWAAARWPDAQRVAALPMPPHGFGWRGLVQAGGEIHEVRFSLLGGEPARPGGEPEWLEPVPAADLAEGRVPVTRELAALAGMARFLSARRSATPDGEVLTFYDRQFAAIPGRQAYEVTVTLDQAGRVVESRFADADVGARTALYGLLVALIAASIRRWEREEKAAAAAARAGE